MRELTWFERHFVAFVVGGIPACILGFVLGLWGTAVGGGEPDLGTVLLRCSYCAVIPVILACLMPRSWLSPVVTYLIGFSMGFGFMFSQGFEGLADMIVAPIYWMEGKHVIKSTKHAHPDLPWILGMALWLAGLASILRRSSRFAAMLRRLEIHPEEEHKS
ncbi:hypothetical protein [Prosthecobacter sp.]|uniref:hypothetical protein n=1 Tax=Prosthecobacter sp. TaxID=1965333 RepID=UPI0024888D18|nr:hypothetical protein [Prosthecobacter sp.]MDI1311472.1 hypothetical protein [Prosthecobacter sp.]